VLLAILLSALALRVYLAATQAYVHDEANTSIPLAQTISFDPGALHLPLRGENHGALPAYVVKVSSAVFGTAPIAYRLGHVLLGLCTIVLVYGLAHDWCGPVAARWAAALLAFNEYYLAVSSRATAHVPYLFFVTMAIFAFTRLLRTGHPPYAYAAGAAVGLAFYCKEHAALLAPVFLIALLPTPYRRWLYSPHVYLAALLCAAVVLPDLYWNLTTDRETARATYRDESVGYATYGSHLERIGGIGVSPYPLMFYTRTAVIPLHRELTGRELRDDTPEYPSMNPLLGLLLLAGVAWTTIRAFGGEPRPWALLLVFWGVFGFFTVIRPGSPPGRLDPVSWIWVEATMVPAVVMTGAVLARQLGARRRVAWALAVLVLLYALAAPAAGIARAAGATAQVAADETQGGLRRLAAGTVVRVRANPLRAVATAAGAGALTGLLIGFGVGRRRGNRRHGG
jgi:4-amino-4-deoxy-L-arabinose transferase-like glycosyltransferase